MQLSTIAETTGAILFTLPFLSAWAKSRPTLGIRLHTSSWGSVYVLQDCQFPHLFKVGTTKRRPSIRKAEIERDMLGGRPTKLIYTVKIPFAESVEKIAHRRLQRRHYVMAGGIEFFRANPETVIQAVRKSCRDVERMAKRQRRWSVEDGLTVREWVATGIRSTG
jgi:hypothetical protein